MEEEHHGKNISGLIENTRHMKERNKYERINESRKNRSAVERKYSERYQKIAYLMIMYSFPNFYYIFTTFLLHTYILTYTNYFLLFFLFILMIFKNNFEDIDSVTELTVQIKK